MKSINTIFNDDILSDKVAFTGTTIPITFSKFRDDVARYAQHFASVDASDVVLYVPNDIYKFCVYLLGLLFSNHNVILPSILTGQNMPSLSDHPLVTNQSDTLSSFGKHISTQTSADRQSNWTFCNPDDRKIHFFTSGSTGTPKQITKTFKMLSDEVFHHTEHMSTAISARPTLVASIAPHHMYGILWRFLFPIYAGIPIDIDLIFTPEELIAKQSKYDHILFVTTPSFLDGISKYQAQYSFASNIIDIVTSGSMLSPATSSTAHKIFGVSPIEIYGSTETGGIASRRQASGYTWRKFDWVHIDTDPSNQIIVNSPCSYQNPYTMSDIIDRIDDCHFILHGRTDRIIKVAEERISLPEMEEHLNTHPYIEKSYLCPLHSANRTTVAAIISLTPSGCEHLVTVGRIAFISEIKRHLGNIVPAVGLPRRFRIVHKIPTNPQGKVLKSDINAILSDRIAEPVVRNLHTTPDTITADLTFMPESEYFRGHFPDYPILPGVVQLHFALKFIKIFFGASHTPAYTITKLKFSSLILPSTTIKFTLTRHNPTTFSFEYTRGQTRCSGGRITFQGAQNV